MRKKSLHKFTVLLLLVWAVTSVKPLNAQGVDPFYSNLFKKGEQSFFNSDYSQAIKELEIAAFGLPQDDPLKTKAYIYMSLSYYYLKDTVNSEKFYITAINSLGDQGFSSIELDDEVRMHFNELARIFSKGEQSSLPYSSDESEKSKAAIQDEEGRTKAEPEKAIDPIKALKEAIKKSPRTPALYYNLYDLYQEKGDTKEAINTLKDMTKKNPNEIDGYLLLGRTYFTVRKYKDAMKTFEKIFELSSKQSIAEPALLESRAYLILSTFYKGDEKKAKQIAGGSFDVFTPSTIESLPLDQVQKNQLAEIITNTQPQISSEPTVKPIDKTQEDAKIEDVKKDPAAESQEVSASDAEISRLKAEIDKNPDNISLCYELYELYRREGNAAEATKAIETLLKNNPNDLDAHLLLSRLNFSQDKFQESINSLDIILNAAKQSGIKRSLLLRTTVYTILCLYYLNDQDNLKAFKEYLTSAAEPQEIEKIIEEEGLASHWEKIIQWEQNIIFFPS